VGEERIADELKLKRYPGLTANRQEILESRTSTRRRQRFSAGTPSCGISESDRHGSSHCGMDNPAIPRRPRRRPSVRVRHSRSRFDLFAFARFDAELFRSASAKNTRPSPKSECLLRSTRWEHPPGVRGLLHPDERTAPSPDPGRIRCTLQSRSPLIPI
jgi:hypothetical protein